MTDKISKFKPQARNANKHTAYGLRLLEKSLREDGFIDAQTAAADGEIISGSARLEKAVEIFTDSDGVEVEPIIVHSDGKRPVIVIRDDIPNAEHPRARRLSVAANKIAQVDFDPDWALLKEWGGEDENIKKLFSDDEWTEGTGEEEPQVDAEPQIDRAAELQEKWQTASGQLWQLGNHRLLIGDCTVRENVERLMGGERAGACVTDVPYEISQKSNGLRKLDYGDWDKDGASNVAFMAIELCKDIPTITAFCGDEQLSLILSMWEDRTKRTVVWVKPNPTVINGEHVFLPACELAAHGRKSGAWFGGKCVRSVWDGVAPTNREHPNQKPLGLIAWIIELTCNVNGIAYDPFCGSGTTIIAAHNLSRRCYAMEISPAYAGVILQRFADATGITPVLVD